MDTRISKLDTYEASEFKSWEEAINWIKRILDMSKEESYKTMVSIKMPPALIRIELKEKYTTKDDGDKEDYDFDMNILIGIDKDNSLEDFIELRSNLLTWLQNLRGVYNDFDIESYNIFYIKPTGNNTVLFEYLRPKE